jgi:hypothetical protein
LLEKQDIPLQGAEPPELLELEDDLMFIAEDPVTYDLVARKVSGGAMITGKAVTTLSGACGRCLEPTEIVLSTGDLQLFVEFENEEIVDITDDNKNVITALIKSSCGKWSESVNDNPQEVPYVVINIHTENQEEDRTVFVYEKNKHYYVEQPYTGIWTATEELYDMVYNYADSEEQDE